MRFYTDKSDRSRLVHQDKRTKQELPYASTVAPYIRHEIFKESQDSAAVIV